jgi:hypothetical protein
MPSDIRTGIITKETYMESAVISYVPYILALPKRKQFDFTADKIVSKEHNVENDSVIPSFVNAEMTEINAAKVSTSSHSFNAYAKLLNLTKDIRKNPNINVQNFHNQILRQLSIQFDKSAFGGEGGNNGLIVSSDANVHTPASVAIPVISGNGFNQIQAIKEIATNLNLLVNTYTASDNLTVFFYGSALLAFLGKITEGQENDVSFHVRQAFKNKIVNFVELSSLSLPSTLTTNGIIVASNDLVEVEHCGLPIIENDGTNDEKGYYYANYRLGSVQVRPEVLGAVIKQAITFAS